ncbi:MAG: helix-turn-helix transcriptional regulator [Chitinispirillaceae bacterium]|nr:helix-turn-helix transcriptional regulator [Chitinispirillaceae bacterium]
MNTVLLKDSIPRIGQILKIYREKTGKNQGDIAQKAGISVSMLSQIERGIVAPSVETLLTVCSVLDLDPSDLFKQISTAAPVRIHHKGERLRNELGGVRYEQLMTSLHPMYQAEMFLIEVTAGKSSTFSGGGHEGTEMGYVLAGSAELTVDTEKYSVKEGDSIYFNAQLPHQVTNTGDEMFRAVWSIAPPHVDFLGIKRTGSKK